MNRVIVIKKCNECPHCVASATEAMELMWVCDYVQKPETLE